MGDAACHLDAVCLSCGRFIDSVLRRDGVCPHCGEPTDGRAGIDHLAGTATGNPAQPRAERDRGGTPVSVVDDTSEFGRRVRRQLESEEVAWLTTVGPDETPQPSPVWFLWTGESALVFSQPNAPKLRNIARRPRVAFHLNSDALGNEVAILVSVARLDGVDPTAEELAAYDAKYRDSIIRLGYMPDQFHGAYSVPIRVEPSKLRGF